MERIVKGIWIPLEIWQDSTLCWNEKILLMEIDSFTAQGKDCFFSNEFIANLLGVSERTAIRYMVHLIDTGYVRVVRNDGRKRYVESVINVTSEVTRMSPLGGHECHPYINHINKPDTDIEERERKRRTPFVKPSVQEVSDFCRERNNGIDAEEFVAFYESKGWMVGKNPMRDWKAAVVTWEKSRKRNTATRREPKKKESVFEHNLRVVDQMFGTNYHERAYGKKEEADEQ